MSLVSLNLVSSLNKRIHFIHTKKTKKNVQKKNLQKTLMDYELNQFKDPCIY